jgi:8-oxo-dGTP pyrophosphatase MutT (NUDIX family)
MNEPSHRIPNHGAPDLRVVRDLRSDEGARTADGAVPSDWLARLERRLLRAPEHRREHWRFGGTGVAPTPAMLERLKSEPVAAAVLIPLFDLDGVPHVLLTQRSPHLAHHAGQISFPGGRIETHDAAPLAAALRETAEEIGIESRFVRPIGYLPDHLVLTGFRITPVVARLESGFVLNADTREVADVLRVPLHVICDWRRYQPSTRELHGFTMHAHDLPYGERLIWGATAGMLLALRAVLMDASYE